MALPGGRSQAQRRPDADRDVSEAMLLPLHATALLRDMSACPEVALVLISASHSALV